jgi:hypothetical protein
VSAQVRIVFKVLVLATLTFLTGTYLSQYIWHWLNNKELGDSPYYFLLPLVILFWFPFWSMFLFTFMFSVFSLVEKKQQYFTSKVLWLLGIGGVVGLVCCFLSVDKVGKEILSTMSGGVFWVLPIALILDAVIMRKTSKTGDK